MGDNQKIDLLFQHKLSAMEMAPSEQAWKSVQSGIATTPQTKKPMWYYAAAAVAMVITSLVILLNQWEETKTYLTGYTDYPIRPSENSWSIHIPERPEYKPKGEKSTKTEKASTPILASSEKENSEMRTLDMPNLEIKTAQSIAMQTPGNLKLEGIEQTEIRNVKITYISGEKKSEPTGSVSLARVLNAAQQVSPSDLLADLREAKNQFLSRN